jgi:hypothetical protein
MFISIDTIDVVLFILGFVHLCSSICVQLCRAFGFLNLILPKNDWDWTWHKYSAWFLSIKSMSKATILYQWSSLWRTIMMFISIISLNSSCHGKFQLKCGHKFSSKHFFLFLSLDDGYCQWAKLWHAISSRNYCWSILAQQVRTCRSLFDCRYSDFLLLFSLADIIELFEAFKEHDVQRNLTIVRLILAAWSISLMQFTLVVTSTKSRKSRTHNSQRTDRKEIHKCFSCRLFWETELWVFERFLYFFSLLLLSFFVSRQFSTFDNQYSRWWLVSRSRHFPQLFSCKTVLFFVFVSA